MLSTIGFDDRDRQTSNQHRETQIRRQDSATNGGPRPGFGAAERQPLKPVFIIVADGRHQLSPLALLLFPERSSLGDRCVVKISGTVVSSNSCKRGYRNGWYMSDVTGTGDTKHNT